MGQTRAHSPHVVPLLVLQVSNVLFLGKTVKGDVMPQVVALVRLRPRRFMCGKGLPFRPGSLNFLCSGGKAAQFKPLDALPAPASSDAGYPTLLQ